MKLTVLLLILEVVGRKAFKIDNNITNFASLFESPIAPRENYSCPMYSENKKLNNFHLRGTALGGWMVLEPWLTPSLFYQFLGATEKWGEEAQYHVAIDSYTFCTALGNVEANRQLRNHWKTWVTEDQIANLHNIGVEHLRLPVGDWMYLPYEPFIGCWDGAIDEVDRVLDLCRKYNIQVIMDLHAVRGSQVQLI
jgi:glucan 1,3-beta-glucosidase